MRRLLRLVPAERRDWVEAVWAEAGQVPPGRHRLSWLAGGVRILAHEVAMVYRLGYGLAFGAGGLAILWVRARNGLPATAVIGLIATGLTLAALPWVGRGAFRPVLHRRLTRGVRLGGYAALLAFLVMGFATARYGKVPANMAAGPADGPLWIVVLLLLAAYAAAILRLTSRRSPASAHTLAIGVGGGVGIGLLLYALMPFGGALSITAPWLAAGYVAALLAVPIGAPAVAGAVAARSRWAGIPLGSATGVEFPDGDQDGVRIQQGIVAGGLMGGAAALVASLVTLPTLMLWPDRVAAVRWSNPADASRPYPTPDDFAMSVSDSVGKYLAFVVAGPVLGMVLGWAGAALAGRIRQRRS